MKNIILAMAFFATVGAVSCDEGYTYSVSNDGGESTIKINDETGYLRLETRGVVTFTDDEAAIKSISDGGFVRYNRNGTKIIARENDNGDIAYAINGGSVKTDLSTGEKKTLAKAIYEMINVGFDAKNRERRLYNKGGSEAVLTAVDDLRSDYIKRVYLEYLIDDNNVTPAEMAKVVRKTASDFNSDYDKSQLLQKMPGSYFQNDETINAYLDAANTINSDYEKDNCLKRLARQPLTPTQYDYLLRVTDKMGSDYDKANVLKELIAQGVPSESNTTSFLAVTQNVNSDYERGNVLKALLEKGVPSGTAFTKFLQVAATLGSDYDKGEVLKAMAKVNIPTDDEWIELIQGTEKIGGDYDKSGALIEIAKYMPKNDKVKGAYMSTAKTITADYNYSQAIKAVN
ncbi:MAG TPA: hypothetical protein VHB48_11580 [Chitinophagaceae bacterium]|nr:hypothetical protein [Chitinophagaceae bacterium]